MSVLAMVGAVVGIDMAAKLAGHKTISEVLRENRLEAAVGMVWLGVHIFKGRR